jgi:hypothetical protein
MTMLLPILSCMGLHTVQGLFNINSSVKLHSVQYNKLNNLVAPTYSSEPSFVTLKNVVSLFTPSKHIGGAEV